MTLRLAAIRQAGKEVVLKLRRANGGAAASEEKKAGAEKIQEAVSEAKGSDVVGKTMKFVGLFQPSQSPSRSECRRWHRRL